MGEMIHLDLKNIQVAPEAIQKVPAKFCMYYKVVPVRLDDNVLTVATTRPEDVILLDELNLVVDGKIKPVLAKEGDIIDAIRRYYGLGAETIERMMAVRPTESRPEEALIEDIAEADGGAGEASISRFLNQILLEAYQQRATDIHIEPFEDTLKVRYRVDGVLYDAKVPANLRHFKDAVNSRIKVLSNLNIAEKRTPQDGRFKVRVQGIDLDLRVSFLPTAHGESVVLRLLNAASLFSLKDLGLAPEELKILQRSIRKPHGIIFLTGPTGSGKTTTLYACLAQVNNDDTKIITIEDPVEYQLNGITQIQVNPQIGLTFAAGLRSMLRHDPDIMMVGEVRDIETADIAIRVALTGHLVFSTLHTNDAAGGVTRLLDMGVEPYLITSTVECFIAQRLIRLICPGCKQPVTIREEDLRRDFKQETAAAAGGFTFYEGRGCEMCHFTGYKGRAAIYEFLVMTPAITPLVLQRASAEQIKEKAMAGGMRTLRRAGWDKAVEGVTSLQEVIRVTKEGTE